MKNFLAILHHGRGQNVDGTLAVPVERSKKQGAIWAVAASVSILATVLFATLSLVGAVLAIGAFVTGAGAALGVFQLMNTVTNLFLLGALAYISANCIQNAQYHFGGRKVIKMESIEVPIKRTAPLQRQSL